MPPPAEGACTVKLTFKSEAETWDMTDWGMGEGDAAADDMICTICWGLGLEPLAMALRLRRPSTALDILSCSWSGLSSLRETEGDDRSKLLAVTTTDDEVGGVEVGR